MRYFSILLPILSLIFITSCQDDITVDIPDSERKLVVDAWIRSDTNMNVVRLSRSSNFSDANIERPETGAQVYISSNGGTRVDFTEDSIGVYVYDQDPNFIIDSVYRLFITTADGVKYQSNDQVLKCVPVIDSLRFFAPSFLKAFGYPDGFFNDGLYPSITAVEKPGKGDFYAWKLYINGEDVSFGNTLFTQDDENFTGGQQIPFGFFVWTDSVGIDTAGRGDTIIAEQMSLNEDAYNYINALQEQFNGGGPFSTPPAPVKGNLFREDDLDETVLGVFILSDSEKKTEIVRPELISGVIDF